MKDILKTLKMIDAIESNKPSKRTLKESAVGECGDMGTMSAPAPSSAPSAAANPGSPVTASITLNASGMENVSDLMKLIQNAGLQPQGPAPAPTLPMRTDMEQLRDKVAALDAPFASAREDQAKEWINEPGEEYADHKFMTQDLAGGINGPKKMYKPAAKGDNPMAVSEKQADPEVIKRVQQLTNVTDINTLKQEILDILNTVKINPKTKPSLLQNIKNSKTRQNLLGLAWNTFVLGKEGQHAITSNWRTRHGITDDIQAEGWKSPSEGEYYDDERDISIRWSADDDGIHIEAYDSEENMVRLSPREENHYEELIRQEMEDDHNEYGDWKYRQSIGDSIKFESIKDRLYKALNEKKSKPDFLDADKDGNKKEPMKKALKDKKKAPNFKKK